MNQLEILNLSMSPDFINTKTITTESMRENLQKMIDDMQKIVDGTPRQNKIDRLLRQFIVENEKKQYGYADKLRKMTDAELDTETRYVFGKDGK